MELVGARFMKHYGLGMRTKSKYLRKCQREKSENDIFPSLYYSTSKENQCGNKSNNQNGRNFLTFGVPNNKTVAMKGAKTVTMNTNVHEKLHYTAVLSCCADGTKLNPVVTFKSKTMPKPPSPKKKISLLEIFTLLVIETKTISCEAMTLPLPHGGGLPRYINNASYWQYI